jgi:hypothetical protein
LKVYTLGFYIKRVQYDAYVATTSFAKAAKLFRTTLYDLKNYGDLAVNDRDIEIALREPGRIFVHFERKGDESLWTYKRMNEACTEVEDEIVR